MDPQSQDPTMTHNTWLNIENIDIDKESGGSEGKDGSPGLVGMASMLGSGQSVGGVVSDTGSSSGQVTTYYYLHTNIGILLSPYYSSILPWMYHYTTC